MAYCIGAPLHSSLTSSFLTARKMGVNVSNHKGSDAIEGEAKSQNINIIEDVPKEASESEALKDDNSVENEAETGQFNKKTGSPHHEEDADHQEISTQGA